MEPIDTRECYQRFLQAGSPEERKRNIGQLVDRLRPILARTVGKELGKGALAARYGACRLRELEQEIVLDAQADLLGGLGKDHEPILNIESYAVKTAKNAVYRFYGAEFPRATNARLRVQIQLNKAAGHFYRWEYESETHVALSAWLPPPPRAQRDRATALGLDSRKCAVEIRDQAAPPPKGIRGRTDSFQYDTPTAMWMTLTWAKGALPFSLLVRAVQAVRNDFDSSISDDDPEGIPSRGHDHASESVAVALARLWSCRRKLDQHELAAILLSRKFDEEVGITLFAAYGVATLEEIGQSMGFTPEHFLNSVLPELPWSEDQIASHIGATKAKVAFCRWEGWAKIKRCLQMESVA